MVKVKGLKFSIFFEKVKILTFAIKTAILYSSSLKIKQQSCFRILFSLLSRFGELSIISYIRFR